jgi:hypothetical protein
VSVFIIDLNPTGVPLGSEEHPHLLHLAPTLGPSDQELRRIEGHQGAGAVQRYSAINGGTRRVPLVPYIWHVCVFIHLELGSPVLRSAHRLDRSVDSNPPLIDSALQVILENPCVITDCMFLLVSRMHAYRQFMY